MKNILAIVTLMVSCTAFSQVIIGDDIGTATDKTSVLLEFAAGQNKGIILPYVRIMPTGTNLAQGTIVLDATDSTKAKVKFYDGTAWFDLNNGNEADITSFMTIQPTEANTSEDSSSKAIIGSRSSDTDGVLVLESATKALVLPIVSSTDDVPDPAPGMMVYINKTGAKRLAVYNGGGWSYWKS